ncbi:MAG TPA: TonB-dependent receptor plug domain-containing protein [Caulobacteraceae bacterium]|nr:TonB-dependent receptor plug domain-containing protein [Caulobacteraceae bacterium]
MPNRKSRIHTHLLCGTASVALMLAAGAAHAQDEKRINIAPQSLSAALHEFGVQSGHPVLFKPSATASKTSPGAVVDGNVDVALAQLLAGTGLSYRRAGDTFLIEQEGGSPQDAGAAGSGAEVEALIVTAQKREEAIQDVPIAISAFTQRSLDAQKIEGGFDLLKAIPNVTFSKSNFSGYNFSIRGIGTKAVSATTDPAVAVSFNSSTLIVNRLFEQEYFDVERVEVLRGPQGTLYGRNATSGVINVISAKPRLMEFEADAKFEVGNYNARRARGMINIPIGETLAVRLAGAVTKRDGYGTNLAATDPNVINDVREDVDGRDLWSTRLTVGWEPIPTIRVNAMWERFEEDDQRVRTSKQLCHHDAGPSTIGSVDASTVDVATRALTSQGCLPGSLYSQSAFGTPNGASLPYISGLYWANTIGVAGQLSNYPPGFQGVGYTPYSPDEFGTPPLAPETAPCAMIVDQIAIGYNLVYPVDICNMDPYRGQMQSTDLRTIHSQIEPIYRAKADLFELSFDFDLTDNLTLTSQTVYSKDEYFASQDYNRYTTFPIFNDSSLACGDTPVPEFDKFGQPTGDYRLAKDCRPEALGTYAPLSDRNGDGIIDQTGAPLGSYTVGTGGYLLGEDGRRVGFYNVTPGGVFTDPQLGPSRSLVAQDLSQSTSEQFNQELRLASNFDGPLNFSLGSNFTHFETINDYYVFLNAATLLTHFFPFNTHASSGRCGPPSEGGRGGLPSQCVYVDPNPLESVNGEGHNYFRSANPYELTSSAVFGELYWQATETVKLTFGARMTWDRKVFTPIPSQLLLNDYRMFVPEGAGPETCLSLEFCQLAGTGVNGRGSPASPDIVQEWREPTGRMIVDWKPELGFTDESMFYLSLAHGYKGGGANPPPIGGPAGLLQERNSGRAAPKTFEPEFVDAIEVGTKNTLLGGALVLNGSLFHYDYEGYQVSKIVDRSASNENFDTKVWGAELEWIYSPLRDLRFNGTLGYLQTEIGEGETSIDLMDRAAGGNTPFTTPGGATFTEWMVIKPWIANSSNCVVPVALASLSLGAESVTVDVNGVPTEVSFGGFDPADYGLWGLCPGGNAVGNQNSGYSGIPDYNPVTDAPNGGAGFAKDLGGNELPNAPHWTMSIGAQYRVALPAGWDATVRVDHYWQDESYARVYNTEYDRLRSWQNTNFSLWFEQPDWQVTAEVYVKNAFDETPITDTFLNSDDSGLTTNVFTLDPRLVGVSIRKQF